MERAQESECTCFTNGSPNGSRGSIGPAAAQRTALSALLADLLYRQFKRAFWPRDFVLDALLVIFMIVRKADSERSGNETPVR